MSPLALHTLDALQVWLISVAVIAGVVAFAGLLTWADENKKAGLHVAFAAVAVCFTMVSLIIFLPTSKSLRETKALCECRVKP